jgi:hypothetical protein
MKRLIKRPLKMVWRWTAFVRRPVQARIEAMLVRCCNRPPHCHVSDETGLVMDHLVREVIRLQKQVESLHQAVEDLAIPSGGLSVVGGLEGEGTESRDAAC